MFYDIHEYCQSSHGRPSSQAEAAKTISSDHQSMYIISQHVVGLGEGHI